MIGPLLLTGKLHAQTADSWPSFRGNPALEGVAPVRLGDDWKLLWSFKTGDGIKSSPILHQGVVFCGSDDGNLYAIDSKGSLVSLDSYMDSRQEYIKEHLDYKLQLFNRVLATCKH